MKLDQWLAEKYINEGLTCQEIAKERGCCRTTVWSRLKKLNIQLRPAKKRGILDGLTNNQRTYWKNVERTREKKRREYQRNKAQKLIAQKRYKQTERGKLAEKISGKRWRTNNPQKVSARHKVKDAIKRGDLVRLPCAYCGDLKTDAHHDDYNKPLDVAWLCRKCHLGAHCNEREQARQASCTG